MQTLIVYASTHRGNTKKVVARMAESISADVVDITEVGEPDISGYDTVGFASGVYFHSFHEKIVNFIRSAAFGERQRVFLVATCGIGYRDYTRGIQKLLAERGVPFAGRFQCRGYDTFGFFGKIGGIAKGHPNEEDLRNAQAFAKGLVSI